MNAKLITTAIVLAIAAAGCEPESHVALSYYYASLGWPDFDDYFVATESYDVAGHVNCSDGEHDVVVPAEIDYDQLDLDDLHDDLHWDDDAELSPELADAMETIRRLREENLELKYLLEITEGRLDSALWALHRVRLHAWGARNYVVVLACIDAHDYLIHRVYYHLNRYHRRWFVDVGYRHRQHRPSLAVLNRLRRCHRQVVRLRDENRRLRQKNVRTIRELRRREPALKERSVRRSTGSIGPTVRRQQARQVKVPRPAPTPVVRKKTDIRRIIMARPAPDRSKATPVVRQRTIRRTETTAPGRDERPRSSTVTPSGKIRPVAKKKREVAFAKRPAEVTVKVTKTTRTQTPPRVVASRERQEARKQEAATRKLETKARRDAAQQASADRRTERKDQRAARVAGRRQVAAAKRASRASSARDRARGKQAAENL